MEQGENEEETEYKDTTTSICFLMSTKTKEIKIWHYLFCVHDFDFPVSTANNPQKICEVGLLHVGPTFLYFQQDQCLE